MKIAQVTSSYYPAIGGVEKVVQKISEELVKKGHEVDVLTTDAKEKTFTKSDINGVTVNRFLSSGPFGYSSALYKYLVACGNNYDIVHSHNFHTLLPLLSAKAKGNGGFKLVLMGHYHGKGHIPLTNFLLKAGLPWFSRNYQNADLILCFTENEKKLLVDHFKIKDNKIKMIQNGAAVQEISSAEPFEKTKRILLIVSRLEKYKNVQMAIETMPYLPEDYQLVVIGYGPYRCQLELLIDGMHLESRVSFLERLSNEEIYRWYKTCDLVINLSDLESFGLTMIEGLAAGKPVLVNNSTALAELAQRFNGVMAVDVRQINKQELAIVIKKQAEKSIYAPDLSDYQWDVIADRLIDYYSEVL